MKQEGRITVFPRPSLRRKSPSIVLRFFFFCRYLFLCLYTSFSMYRERSERHYFVPEIMQQRYSYVRAMICLPIRDVQSWFQSMLQTILTVVLRKNQPMIGNGSNAGPLTLGMEEKYVVRVTGNEDPSEKRLIQSQPTCH